MNPSTKPSAIVTRSDGTRALMSETGLWLGDVVQANTSRRRFHFGHTLFITVVVLVCFAAITVGVRVITAH